MSTQRITVTLPHHLVEQIDRLEPNRSGFITDAVRRELERRRRESLYESLSNPHPEGLEVAEAGFDDWAAQLPSEQDDLVEADAGRPIRWRSDLGWRSTVDRKPSGDGDEP